MSKCNVQATGNLLNWTGVSF